MEPKKKTKQNTQNLEANSAGLHWAVPLTDWVFLRLQTQFPHL